MSDRFDEPRNVRLEALEPGHVAAFKAFQRGPRPADRGLRDESLVASALEPTLNPELARRLYGGIEGTLDLVPGPDRICCVAINAQNGERMTGTTSTALAAHGGHGYIRSSGERSVTFIGVVPAGARDLRIIDRSGQEITVPVNDDDAYWIMVSDPIEMVWTQAGGTYRQIPIA